MRVRVCGAYLCAVAVSFATIFPAPRVLRLETTGSQASKRMCTYMYLRYIFPLKLYADRRTYVGRVLVLAAVTLATTRMPQPSASVAEA